MLSIGTHAHESEAEEAVRSYGLAIAPVRLTQRAAYVHSLTAGQAVIEFEPEGKAAQEIKELYKWTYTRVHASLAAVESERMRA